MTHHQHLTDRLRDLDLDERAARLADRLRDLDLDDRAARAAERLRTAAGSGSEAARRQTAQALAALAAALGEDDARSLTRRLFGRAAIPWWAAGALGFAAGLLVGRLLGSRDADREAEFVASAQRLVDDAEARADAALADRDRLRQQVERALADDPRTANLDSLRINVAGTVAFVRGAIPDGLDEDVVREVVRSVDGVEDVDLEVTSSA